MVTRPSHYGCVIYSLLKKTLHDQIKNESFYNKQNGKKWIQDK